MKKLSVFALAVMITALVAVTALVSRAADAKKPKPYLLDICVVSDEKLGADPGMEPHVFVHEGREVKLCCKPCLKEFKKEPAKYIAKIEAAEKKAK